MGAELEKLKAELQEHKLIFNLILEGTLAGYWDWHIPSGYEYLSPGFKAMFGYAEHEMENKPESWQKIIHPDDLSKTLDIYQRHVDSKGDVPYSSAVRYYHKDGSLVDVFCRGKVVEWSESGDPLRMIGAHIDVTELRTAQRKLARTSKVLKRRNRQLEDYAYITSHNLRSHASNLQMLLDLHELEQPNPEASESVISQIRDISKNLLDTLSLLNESLRIRTADNVELKKMGLQDTLQHALDELKDSIASTGTQIQADFSKAPQVFFSCDYLRSLMLNLISNSIKYRIKEQPLVIVISSERALDKTVLRFSDNGQGLDMSRFGDKLFGLEKTFHGNSDAQGIGLFITRTQLESLGAAIVAHSKAGLGMELLVEIPDEIESSEDE